MGQESHEPVDGMPQQVCKGKTTPWQGLATEETEANLHLVQPSGVAWGGVKMNVKGELTQDCAVPKP